MSKKKTKNKKKVVEENKSKSWIWGFIFLIVIFCIGAFIYSNTTNASKCVKEYFALVNNKEYDKAYDLVLTDMPKEDFVNRLKNIYEGIEAKDISVTISANSQILNFQNNTDNTNNKNSTNNEGNNNVNSTENSEQNNQINIDDQNNESGITTVSFSNSMQTVAGNINFMNKAKVKEDDGKYKILWDSSVIYPDLDDDEKVRVQTIECKRGSILDRNDIPIAKDGEVYQVGLVPRKNSK